MSFVKSNRPFTRPRNKDLKVPETMTEFQSLNYLDRLQLQQEHPAIYRKFADRAGKMSWED